MIKDKMDLRKYCKNKLEIVQLRDKIQEVEQSISGVKAQVLTGMPKGSGARDSMGDIIAKLDSMYSEYSTRYSQLLDEQKEVEQLIDTLDSTERVLMRCRYIDCMKWEDICVELDKSWQWTHKLHARILIKIFAKK